MDVFDFFSYRRLSSTKPKLNKGFRDKFKILSFESSTPNIKFGIKLKEN